MTETSGGSTSKPALFKPVLRPEDRGLRRRYRNRLYIGLAIALPYIFFVAWFSVSYPLSLSIAFVVGPAVFVVLAPLLTRMLSKVEDDARVRGIVVAGLGAKIFGGYSRYLAAEFVIGGGDNIVYHIVGSNLASEFRALVFGGPIFQGSFNAGPGTNFIRLFTGIAYTFIGTSFTVGFLFYAILSFWGLYFFYRAFALALPDGDRRMYALIVFFLPSMLFWPSSIGKEAWMSLCIGAATYGMARLLTQQRHGYLTMFLGLAGMAVVRPHLAAIFGVGLVGAFLLRRSDGDGAAAKKIAGLLVFAAAAGLLMSQLQSFFGLEDGLDPNQVFENTTERTSQGGSQFEAVQPSSPIGLPWAVITVLFRPFLYEAGGAAGLIAALESTFLIGLFIINAHRIARVPRDMIRYPYIGFAVLYMLVFAFAFSSISNFGILVRQRTQLLPIATILLCTPSVRTLFWSRRQELLQKRSDSGLGPAEPQGEMTAASHHIM